MSPPRDRGIRITVVTDREWWQQCAGDLVELGTPSATVDELTAALAEVLPWNYAAKVADLDAPTGGLPVAYLSTPAEPMQQVRFPFTKAEREILSTVRAAARRVAASFGAAQRILRATKEADRT